VWVWLAGCLLAFSVLLFFERVSVVDVQMKKIEREKNM
jgi:hypothetical protein